MLYTSVTSGIKISVSTRFEKELSRPSHSDFLFSYTISIKNLNDYPVRLLSRLWYIDDSTGESRKVEGLGVVGEQPTILAKEIYTYTSACDLKSDMGKMKGFFKMISLMDESNFVVKIPDFILVAPFRLN